MRVDYRMHKRLLIIVKIANMIRTLKEHFLAVLKAEEDATIRKIAHRYALRREMDAEIDQQGRRWDTHGQEVKGYGE
jgi:hypothetical protein